MSEAWSTPTTCGNATAVHRHRSTWGDVRASSHARKVFSMHLSRADDSDRSPAAARPDEDASFAQGVLHHTAALLRVDAALVGVAHAKDAAQEALVHAWHAWAKLRDGGALRPWLLRITVNVCREGHRGGFGRHARLTE